MAVENEVWAASDRFYAALNRVVVGDPAPMLALWTHAPDATAMHTLGDREVGWERVRAEWERVAGLLSGGLVTVSGLLVRAEGDLAYTVGRERVEVVAAGRELRFDVRVTNVFRREDGAWKVVHHHADAAPAMEDVSGRR